MTVRFYAWLLPIGILRLTPYVQYATAIEYPSWRPLLDPRLDLLFPWPEDL